MREVTDTDFDDVVLDSDLPVVVDFWAPWCGPCRLVTPLLEEIADEYRDQLRMVKVNVDDNAATAHRYDVRGIPAIKVFVGGQVVKDMIGPRPKRRLMEELTEFL